MYYGYRIWLDGNCVHEDVGDTYFETEEEAIEEGRQYALETIHEWNADAEYNYSLDDIEIEAVEIEEDEDE